MDLAHSVRSVSRIRVRTGRLAILKLASTAGSCAAYMDAIWSYPWIVEWGTAAEYETPISRYDDI